MCKRENEHFTVLASLKAVRCTLPYVHVCMFTCAYVCLLLSVGVEGVEVGVVGGIDRPVRGAARSSRSSCPLGVKDTDVTALITEAGSQRYQHSQQQLSRTLLR